MSTTIIGLYSSAPQCGKSETATVLVNTRGFVRIPFAAPLKAMARPMFKALGYSDQEIYLFETTNKSHTLSIGRTVRYIYQTLGTEWGRKCVHPELWVMLWEAQVRAFMDKGYSVVADDMRFPNEYEAVAKLNGEHWKIERACAPAATAHASEGALDEFMFPTIIENNGTLDDLRDAVTTALGHC